MLVSKALLSTVATVSKDNSHPLLTAIRIYKEDDKIVSVATDGYILSEVIESTPSDDDFPDLPFMQSEEHPDSVLVPAETAKKMMAAMKKNDTGLPVLSYAKLVKGSIFTTDLDQTIALHFRSPDGNYPEYRKYTDLTEEEAKTYKTVKLNPKYLKKTLALFKDDLSVELSISDDKFAPVFIRSEEYGINKTALIMPLKDKIYEEKSD